MPKKFNSGRRAPHQATNPLLYCLKIGIYSGVVWGLIRWLAVAMNFTKVPAAFLLDPLIQRSTLVYVYWQIAGFALFVLMSMAAAFLYYWICRKFRGPLAGLLFGVLWWGVLYLAAGPLIGAVPPLNRIGWNSIITDLCIFTAWGVFIGYSMAFEFHDEWGREPEPASA